MRSVLKFLLVLLVLSLALPACSAPPDKTVTEFMDAMKALDKEEMAKYIILEGDQSLDSALKTDDPTGAEVLRTIFDKMTYQVDKATVSGDDATAPVKITCVDMTTVIAGVMSKAMGLALATAFGDDETGMDVQAMTEQMLINALTDPNAPMTTQSVSLPLKKVQGKWLIVWDDQSSDAFMNAATGNLGKIFGKDEGDTP